MITCSCNDPSCKSNIRIDGNAFWIQGKGDEQLMIYLDANQKVALIRELHASLVPEELKRP